MLGVVRVLCVLCVVAAGDSGAGWLNKTNARAMDLRSVCGSATPRSHANRAMQCQDNVRTRVLAHPRTRTTAKPGLLLLLLVSASKTGGNKGFSRGFGLICALGIQ